MVRRALLMEAGVKSGDPCKTPSAGRSGGQRATFLGH